MKHAKEFMAVMHAKTDSMIADNATGFLRRFHPSLQRPGMIGESRLVAPMNLSKLFCVLALSGGILFDFSNTTSAQVQEIWRADLINVTVHQWDALFTWPNAYSRLNYDVVPGPTNRFFRARQNVP